MNVGSRVVLGVPIRACLRKRSGITHFVPEYKSPLESGMFSFRDQTFVRHPLQVFVELWSSSTSLLGMFWARSFSSYGCGD